MVSTTNLNGQFESVKVSVDVYKLKTPSRIFRNRLWQKPDKFHLTKEDFYDSSWLTYLRAQLTFGYSGNIDKSTTPFIKALLFTDRNSSRLASEIENPGNPALKS